LTEALDEIEKMGALASLTPLELALKSELLLRKYEFDQAEELRDIVARMTDDAANARGKYINLWVRSMRARIEGDYALDRYLVGEVAKLPVSRRLRDLLTMPD